MEKGELPPTPDIRYSPESTVSALSFSIHAVNSETMLFLLPKIPSLLKTARWIISSVIMFPRYFPYEVERLERYADMARRDNQTKARNYTENSLIGVTRRGDLIDWMIEIQRYYNLSTAFLFQWIRLTDLCFSEPQCANQKIAELVCLSTLQYLQYDGAQALNDSEMTCLIPVSCNMRQLERTKRYVDDLCEKFEGFPDVHTILKLQQVHLHLPYHMFTHCLFILEYNLYNTRLIKKSLLLIANSCLHYVLTVEKSESLVEFERNTIHPKRELKKMADELISYINQDDTLHDNVVKKYRHEGYNCISKRYFSLSQ